MQYIFKCYKTPGGFYLYDRHMNSAAAISEEDYLELKRVEEGGLEPEKSPVLKYYQEFGMLQENTVREIKHPATDYLEYMSGNKMKHLTLQVTQQCNLRCHYCAYSGIYDNRTHSNKKMSFETAKKAIDFFFANSEESNEVRIAFYGGEPLLEKKLIRQCVEYVESINEGKHVSYGMTTNGTLLDEETAKFLYEHDFQFSISLDGSREEHDINRRFASNNKGSFDIIMENVKRIRRDYPEYSKNISFMATINPKMKLDCVLEFFSTDSVLSDSYIIYNEMVSNGLKEDDWQFDESYDLIRRYEYVKFLFMLIGRLGRECISPMMLESQGHMQDMVRRLKTHDSLPAIWHHNGPCIPGVKRVLVTVDGKIYPCEKVSESHDFFCIGDLDRGFYLDKMKNLVNNGKVTEDLCKDCWCMRNCSICSAQVEIDDDKQCVDRASKQRECANQKRGFLASLYEISVLKEFGCDLLESGVED